MQSIKVYQNLLICLLINWKEKFKMKCKQNILSTLMIMILFFQVVAIWRANSIIKYQKITTTEYIMFVCHHASSRKLWLKMISFSGKICQLKRSLLNALRYGHYLEILFQVFRCMVYSYSYYNDDHQIIHFKFTKHKNFMFSQMCIISLSRQCCYCFSRNSKILLNQPVSRNNI